jgi:hypothetical protein
VRPAMIAAIGIAALSACSWNRRPPAVVAVAAPVEVDPFDHTSVSFVVAGAHFMPGETAIVKVCVSPQGVVSSADVLLPSGDKRFDDFAVNWARQVKLASVAQSVAQIGAQSGEAKELCGPVRVEIKVSPVPRVLSGADSALG